MNSTTEFLLFLCHSEASQVLILQLITSLCIFSRPQQLLQKLMWICFSSRALTERLNCCLNYIHRQLIFLRQALAVDSVSSNHYCWVTPMYNDKNCILFTVIQACTTVHKTRKIKFWPILIYFFSTLSTLIDLVFLFLLLRDQLFVSPVCLPCLFFKLCSLKHFLGSLLVEQIALLLCPDVLSVQLVGQILHLVPERLALLDL